MSQDAHRILHALQDIKSSLYDALAQPRAQIELLRTCLQRFVDVKQELDRCKSSCSFKADEAKSISAAAESIGSISQLFVDMETFHQQCNTNMLNGAAQLLKASSDNSVSIRSHLSSRALRSSPPADGADQMLNSTIMRRWMLQHLDHPFPNVDERVAITKESNKNGIGPKGELNPNQCTLWFINARRRSGWTKWARRFADGQQSRLRAIVAAIEGRVLPKVEDEEEEIEDDLEKLVVASDPRDLKLPEAELVELCKSELDKVVDWVLRGANQKVGSWMDNIVKEAKVELKKKRKQKRAMRRAVERKKATKILEQLDSEEDELEDTPPPAVRRPTSSRAPPPPQQQQQHRPGPYRQPTALARPATRNASGASTSDNSYSSFGSMVSGRLRQSSRSSVTTQASSSMDTPASTSGKGKRKASAAPYPPRPSKTRAGQGFSATRPAIAVSPPSPIQTNNNIGIHMLTSVSLYSSVQPPAAASGRQQTMVPSQQQQGFSPMPIWNSTSDGFQGYANLLGPNTQASSGARSPGASSSRTNGSQGIHFSIPMNMTASVAVGNNWGMPSSSNVTYDASSHQARPAANFGGWLAWSGQS